MKLSAIYAALRPQWPSLPVLSSPPDDPPTTQQSTHPSAYQGQTVIAPYNHEKKEIVE